MLLLYADDVVLLAHTLGDAQKLMKALEIFCMHTKNKTKTPSISYNMHTKLIVNSSNTNIMLVKSQKRVKPCIIYNNEPLECVESFKYLGLEVPSNHRWNECATRRLEAGKRAYYAFENT